MSTETSLKDWIQEEMTVSEENILGAHKERIARILGITQDGEVLFRVDKNQLDAEGQIGAYMIGKLFAQVAGYAEDAAASNQEFEQALRMRPGTIRGTLKRMRDKGTAESTEPGLNRVPINNLPKVLKQIESQTHYDRPND